jgi:hypothetical protein
MPSSPANVGATVAGGGGSMGARVLPTFHDHKPHIVGVDVDDLEDFKSSSLEEFGQFAFGEFLVAGAFWLGFERRMTVTNWQGDLLFWICVVSTIAGVIIGGFGLRQMIRRHRKIDRIVQRAREEENV